MVLTSFNVFLLSSLLVLPIDYYILFFSFCYNDNNNPEVNKYLWNTIEKTQFSFKSKLSIILLFIFVFFFCLSMTKIYVGFITSSFFLETLLQAALCCFMLCVWRDRSKRERKENFE